AIILWGWHHFSINWVYKSDNTTVEKADGENKMPPQEAQQDQSYLRRLITDNRRVVIVIVAGFIALVVAASVVDGFFEVRNLISVAVFIAFVIGVFVLNKFITVNKSAFFGMAVLIGLFIIGSLIVEGFLSSANIKSMLVFASFLGLASIGQTLVALLAGLDLSIPFVIGSSNIGLMWLFTLGVPPWIAVIIILLLGALIGFINGILSFRLQGQALIMTLGVGFFVTGGAQIITSIGSAFGGTVFGVVPSWLTNIAAMNGTTFGLQVPPVILIWIAISVILVVGLRNTSYGRNLYALGGSRTAAKRLSISERRYWIGVYTLSGTISAFTGALLLGWSGGGFVGVGDQYLFMTLAAVVVGGTSLLGGRGGYGFTVIGVLVLQVLTSFLVGIGLDFEGQQFVFGLLILPMVALYARSPHISTQI
ncbi:MAG: ABC transporter permease, partial [Paracoccaceae bacterium]|nr:ABC transporter permease [Paracoccaceae bacterium]